MTAHQLEVRFSVEPTTDLVEPDLGVNLRERLVDAAMVVEGADQAAAVSVGFAGLRSALARAGHDVRLDGARTTVRPPEAA